MTAVPSQGLPITNSAFEPAWVRSGSQRIKDDYRTAQAFEAMLVEQLASAMSESGAPGSSSGEGADGEQEGSLPSLNGGALSALLPQALSKGVLSGGGLGLAAQITRDLEGPRHAGSEAATGPGAAATGGAGTAAAIEPASGGTTA